MKYKLLVLDVDGTLLNDEREISKRTLAALLKVQQMGVPSSPTTMIPSLQIARTMNI